MRIARIAATVGALAVLFAASVFGGSALGPTPQAAALVMPTAVFLGDSYTQAGGLTEAQRWPTIAAKALGWQHINLGRGGSGYLGDGTTGQAARLGCGLAHCPSYTGMIPAAVEHEPAVIVVSGGRNDMPRWTDPAWAQGVIDFYAELRAAAPTADIYAVAPIWDDDPAPAEAIFARLVVRVAVTDVGGTYVDLGEPLAGRSDLIGRDGVHPNAAGHQVLADTFTAAIS